MECPKNPTIWYDDTEAGDPRWADHLAICPSCRAEADQMTALTSALQTLPAQEAPASIALRLQALTTTTAGQTLGCADTRELLESYREGLLPAAQDFLVQDHLLWCDACAEELAAADALAGVLRALPQHVPPASIAERLALARRPWWQRLWTPPAPSWSLGRLWQTGGALAAVAVLLAIMMVQPQNTGHHDAKQPIEKRHAAGGHTLVQPPTETPIETPLLTITLPESTPVAKEPQPKMPGAVITDEVGGKQPTLNTPVNVPGAPGHVEHAPVAPKFPTPGDDPAIAAVLDPPVIPVAPVPHPNPMLPDKNPSTGLEKVVASARAAMERARWEYELARSEEELFALPDNAKIMASANLAAPNRVAPAKPAVSMDAVNGILRSQHLSPELTQMVIKNEAPRRANDHAVLISLP